VILFRPRLNDGSEKKATTKSQSSNFAARIEVRLARVDRSSNSRITLHFATGLHDCAQPCWSDTGLLVGNYFFPMHLKTTAPATTNAIHDPSSQSAR